MNEKADGFHRDAKTTAYNHVLFLCEEHGPRRWRDGDDPYDSTITW